MKMLKYKEEIERRIEKSHSLKTGQELAQIGIH